MNRIRRTSVDIKNVRDFLPSPSSPASAASAAGSNGVASPTGASAGASAAASSSSTSTGDARLVTLRRVEHLIGALREMCKFLGATPLVYEAERYEEPLRQLLALHRHLRQAYHGGPAPVAAVGPGRATDRAALIDGSVLRLVQFVELLPLPFMKAKSGGAVHDLQTTQSRRQVLLYAQVLRDRGETLLELAGLPLP